MDGLDELAGLYADPLRAAQAWKATGGKVVGYLEDNVPDELIAAAGFFPLRIKGSPDTDTGLVDDRVDRLYPPDVTVRPPYVTAMLARLEGLSERLDLAVLSLARDAGPEPMLRHEAPRAGMPLSAASPRGFWVRGVAPPSPGARNGAPPPSRACRSGSASRAGRCWTTRGGCWAW